MKKKINLDDLKKENIFKIPEGYFENFSERLLPRLKETAKDEKAQKSPISVNIRLDEIKKENIFAVPTSYFEELSSNINTNIELGFFTEQDGEEIEEDLGILSSLEKKNIFSAPDGYFENFAITIGSEILGGNKDLVKSKTISFIPNWLTYFTSAAAVFILMFAGLGFYKNNQVTTEPCKELLCNVTDDEILQYLDENGIGVEVKETNKNKVDDTIKNNKSITEDEILNEIDPRLLED